MGNLLQTEMEGDVAQIASEAGATVTWNGAEYTAIIGEPAIAVDLVTGGLSEGADFVVKFVRADLTDGKPAFKDAITIDSVKYYVAQITDRAGAAWFVAHVKR